ncbi:MAG: VCBS repeat domain-containing M23 family metallopeptidase, partial [Anaerolineae bacterium]|nr:VCBS repeat domain-containing M23 family metallopeptidase [Anaerolineae bacterium]
MRRLLFIPVLLIVLIAPFFVTAQPAEPLPLPPAPETTNAVASAAEAALLGTSANLRADPSQALRVRAGDISVRDGWAFGLLTVRVPDGLHAEPEIRLFLSVWDAAAGWQTLLEGTPEFEAALLRVPAGVMPEAARSTMAQGVAELRSGASMGLPFAVGETWALTGGPHPNGAGTNSRPWSAIDIAFPGSVAGRIRAAEGGVAWVPSDCPNLVRIDHAGGWRTGYYHVINIRVGNGQIVQRGQWIADEGAATGCGGFATGPHLHFSLRRYTSTINPDAQTFVDIGGTVLGGWQVQDGGSPYQGCMQRTRDAYRVCANGGLVTYETGGVIPTSVPNPTPVGPTPTPLPPSADRRYDYDRDGYADLWVVDQRPDDGGDTRVAVYDGQAPTQLVHFKQTTLPQQPIELNTSFATGDYNGDGTPDLWLFHRRMDTSRTTAVRILDVRGEIVYDLLEDTPTGLPEYNDTVRFAVADHNRDGRLDVYAFVPDLPNNTTRVRIVSGVDFSTVLANNVTTALPAVGSYDDAQHAVADFNNDGTPDLWQIMTRAGANGQPTVRVVNGANRSQVLASGELALSPTHTNMNLYGYVVADWNRDNVPDVWRVNRRNGVIAVISGANWTTVLYNGASGVRGANSLDGLVLGSDRGRERIPPQAPVALSPANWAVSNTGEVAYYAGTFGNQHHLTFYDALGAPLLTVRQHQNWPSWCAARCTVNPATFGLTVRDGQQYQWDVRASNAYGVLTSERRWMSIDRPGPVTLIDPAPAQSRTNPLTFSWQTVAGANRYIVYVR